MAASEALRLSEIRAVNLDDYQDGCLLVGRSIQGSRLDAPIVDWTKNNSAEWRDLWFEPLREWIEWRIAQASPEKRLRGEVALFWNPSARNTAKRWTPDALERQWHHARKAADLHISRFRRARGIRCLPSWVVRCPSGCSGPSHGAVNRLVLGASSGIGGLLAGLFPRRLPSGVHD